MQQNATLSNMNPATFETAFSETPFTWTKQTEQAALLVAEGRYTEAKIAARLKVDRTTLWRWRQQEGFIKRVQEHVAAFRKAIREEGIAVLENRLQRLNGDWLRMQELVQARAQDAADTRQSNKKAVEAHVASTRLLGASEAQIKMQVADILKDLPRVAPGMETGLIVRGYKVAGGQMVEEFTFDAALLKEIRGHEEQAAKELGQWTEKRDVTSGGKPLTDGPDLRRLSAERLAQLEEILLEAEPKMEAEDAGASAPKPAAGES